MKKNITIFARLLPVILVIAVGTTACSRKNRFGSVLPGRTSDVTDGGIAGRGTPGGNRNIDNVPPIGGNNGLNPGGIGVNPIPVVPEGGLGTDSGKRTEFDGMDRHPETFETQTVYFDLDKWNIRPSEIEKIKTVATHLKANASHKLEVEGHCDERGTEEYNRSLGEKRAQSIREFLAREGVSPDNVRTVSYGEDKPADPSHNEGAWSKNRRGVFILLTPPKTL